MADWFSNAQRILFGVSSAFIFTGCIHHQYFALQNGYGSSVVTSSIPDSGAHMAYSYMPTKGSRRILWPSIFSGYYGSHIIHDDIIVFGVDLDATGAGHVSNILAAKGGPPAVDITKAIVRVAQEDGSDTRALDFGYTGFSDIDSGVSIQFQRWSEEQKRFNQVAVLFGWKEIGDLVAQLRNSGTTHGFKGVRYYAED